MWDKVVGLNLKGPFRLTALVGPRMVADGRGLDHQRVEHRARSVRRRSCSPTTPPRRGSTPSPWASPTPRGPTVRVNCIMAGPFFTDVTKEWDLEAFEATAKERIALGRGGRPEEIVGTALYFASDASSFTTGAVLRVDGGIP